MMRRLFLSCLGAPALALTLGTAPAAAEHTQSGDHQPGWVGVKGAGSPATW